MMADVNGVVSLFGASIPFSLFLSLCHNNMTDPAIKCVVVGDREAGKSAFLATLTSGAYPAGCPPTVVSNYLCTRMVDGQMVSACVWDTSGAESTPETRPLSYAQTDVFVILCDVATPATFEHARSLWAPELRRCSPDVPFLLVGNNTEVREDSAAIGETIEKCGRDPIAKEEGEAMAKEIGACKYLECSTVKCVGVRSVFEEAIRAALTKTRAPKKHRLWPFK